LPVIPATWEAEAGRLRFGDSLDKFSVSNKRTGGTAQVVEHFPGKLEALVHPITLATLEKDSIPCSRARRCTPVTPALRRLRQEDWSLRAAT
jgi:hypothetical protein